MNAQYVIHYLLVRWPRMHVTLNHCSLLYLDDESQLGSEKFIPSLRHIESTAIQEPKLQYHLSSPTCLFQGSHIPYSYISYSTINSSDTGDERNQETWLIGDTIRPTAGLRGHGTVSMAFFIKTPAAGHPQLMASFQHHQDLAGLNSQVMAWAAVSAISQVEDMAACAAR